MALLHGCGNGGHPTVSFLAPVLLGSSLSDVEMEEMLQIENLPTDTVDDLQ